MKPCKSKTNAVFIDVSVSLFNKSSFLFAFPALLLSRQPMSIKISDPNQWRSRAAKRQILSYVPDYWIGLRAVCAIHSDVRYKEIPYSLPNVGPGADPGVHSHSQPKDVTVIRPVPCYTAWWQRYMGANNLPMIVTTTLSRWKLNPRLINRMSNALPLRHCVTYQEMHDDNISSAIGQPTRSTQPFILSGSINE